MENLRSTAKKEYIDIAQDLDLILTRNEREGQSLILYADDILKSTTAVDLENTLRYILKRHSTLNNGKIVLFARKEANATILARMIDRAAPDLEVITVTHDELKRIKNLDGTETDEVESLVEFARCKGARDILGLVKGPSGDIKKNSPEDLAALSRSLEVPIVLVGMEEGLYSLASAIIEAAKIKEWSGARGWLMILPPIRTVAEDIKSQHEEYHASRKRLVSA